ncbi:MAG TPA: TonB-dependent receptor, partial [Adhaeribacter sp.]|nr:TonB-dependent receptor [Adhaeribacter sp.]
MKKGSPTFRILLKHLLLFIAFSLPFNGPLLAQPTFELTGTVRDAQTRELLPGAAVYPKNDPQAGSLADAKGNFRLTLAPGNHTILVKYLGYLPLEQTVFLNRDLVVHFQLHAQSVSVTEVEITSRRPDENLRSTQMGEVILPLEQIKTLPVIFGETDIIKTLQLLPGVKSGGEGNTGFYVRGGGADQNLVLLNDATVYNPGHLMNFFSVFNSDALQSTTLIKGTMPARYGGRLSSVLDITTRPGNPGKFTATGGLGLIASRLTLEGPVVNEKASFRISGRRTYIDQLAGPFLKNTEQGGVPYYFYDLDGSLSFSLSPKDQLFLGGYFGRDVGQFSLSGGTLKAKFDWGNTSATARWTHIFSDKLALNVAGLHSGYQFNFTSEFDAYTASLLTSVKDYGAKADLDWNPDSRNQVRVGAQYTHHTLRPRSGQAQTTDGLDLNTSRVLDKFAHEAAVYASENWAITEDLEFSAGLRGSFFWQVGPFNYYNFNQNGSVTDSTVYKKGEKVRSFRMAEPRLAMRYSLSSKASVKAGFSRNAQYLHLVSNSFTSLPLDIWVPAS